MTHFAKLQPIAVFLILAILLGGASAAGFFANLALQVIGVAILAWAVSTTPQRELSPAEGALSWIAALGLAIIMIQFVPLPLRLWAALPEREAILASARAAGIEPGPVFLSLMPHAALRSAIWLLPAMAVLFALLRIKPGDPRPLAWAIQVGMVLSVLAGALQLAGGPRSAFYFYDITNRGSTVGFFANANHQTTLLLVALPFLAALVRTAPKGPRRPVVLALAAGSLVVDLVGIFVNGSLFGYGLVLPVLAGSALILVRRTPIRRLSAALLFPIVILGMAIVLTTGEGQQMLADSSTLSPSSRNAIFAHTWSAITEFMPVGSGLGSFEQIYRLSEDPAAVRRLYVNHAHNDYLELLLETGALGALVTVVFLGWWLRLALGIWHARHFDAFAGAAVVASAAILVHSLVDYPLRTAAISCIFAACCALMARWKPDAKIRAPRTSLLSPDEPLPRRTP